MKRILYLTVPHQDYLSDSILIGLKKITPVETIDFPPNRFIYKNTPQYFEQKQHQLYGNGFTLYNLLEKKYKFNQSLVQFTKHQIKDFDLVIFSSIWSQLGMFLEFYNYLTPSKTIILDGEDTPIIFPYHGNFLRKFRNWWIPKPLNKFEYYKREWTPKSIQSIYLKILPQIISQHLLPNKLRTISFSIPEEKIIKTLPKKEKLFPSHIVDKEVAEKLKVSQEQYVFNKEEDYYQDLQKSKFGITTKRAGWDCMRHYEIAANGAIICFRDLDKKPDTCAPHDLIPNVNCISYKNFEDLMQKINTLTDVEYEKLVHNSLNWIKQKTCQNLVSKLLITNLLIR